MGSPKSRILFLGDFSFCVPGWGIRSKERFMPRQMTELIPAFEALIRKQEFCSVFCEELNGKLPKMSSRISNQPHLAQLVIQLDDAVRKERQLAHVDEMGSYPTGYSVLSFFFFYLESYNNPIVRSINDVHVPLEVRAISQVLFSIICQLQSLSKDTEKSLLDSLKRHKVLFLGTIMGSRGSYCKVRAFFHFLLLPAFLQLNIFLPLISAPTGFHDWGLVTRWA